MHIKCPVSSTDNPSEEAETCLSLRCSVVSNSLRPPRTIACQGPLSMGFSWQEYWSGLLFPPLEDIPDQGTEPMSPMSLALQVDFLPLSHQGNHKVKLKLTQSCPTLCQPVD